MSRANLILLPGLHPRVLMCVTRAVVAAALVLIASAMPFVRVAATGSRAQHPPNCFELVANGSFEEVGVGWQSLADASLFTYATDQVVSGQQSLLLGFTSPVNMTATFGVEQRIALPAESANIEFALHYAIHIDGDVGPGDSADLLFTDATTNQLLAMSVLSPTGGAWTTGRYDLTSLAGKEMVLTFSVQNDGEPGRLAMRVDDVSILACLPPEAFAVPPLPTFTPTPVPPTPEPLLLEPLALPTSSTPLPATPAGNAFETPVAPASATVVPQMALVDSLEGCSCTSALFSCSSFSSWAVAQACYTHCQVAAGYDIHNLDPDRNGVACELELQDVAPLDTTPSPQPTPPTDPISTTSTLEPNNSHVPGLAATTVVTQSQLPGQSVSVSPTQSPAVTTTLATGELTAATTLSPTTMTVGTDDPVQTDVTSTLVPTNTAANTGNPLPLSPLEMLTLLLFSPLGAIVVTVFVVAGALGLWAAYVLGQSGNAQLDRATTKSVPEEFMLQANIDTHASETKR